MSGGAAGPYGALPLLHISVAVLYLHALSWRGAVLGGPDGLYIRPQTLPHVCDFTLRARTSYSYCIAYYDIYCVYMKSNCVYITQFNQTDVLL